MIKKIISGILLSGALIVITSAITCLLVAEVKFDQAGRLEASFRCVKAEEYYKRP